MHANCMHTHLRHRVRQTEMRDDEAVKKIEDQIKSYDW